MPETQASIFLRLQETDQQIAQLSWHEFYARYAPVISAFARRRGAQQDEADDIVQTVLLGFFKASPDFRYDPSKGRFRSYLKTATVRAMQRSRAASQRAHIGGPAVDEERDAAPDDTDQLAEDWEWAWQRAILRRALQDVRGRVDVKTFNAFELAAMHKVPSAEVGRRLGMSEDAVRQAKSRVNRQVRETAAHLRDREG
jgi:RNA polymerase sigma-70 factor (ECF subfamily)